MPVRDPDATARVLALVMERLGLEGKPGAAGELARIIGMPPYSEGNISLVRRWLRGAHAPSFEYTMELLSKAGLLTPAAEAAWTGLALDPAAEARAAKDLARQAADASAQLGRAARPRRKRASG